MPQIFSVSRHNLSNPFFEAKLPFALMAKLTMMALCFALIPAGELTVLDIEILFAFLVARTKNLR